MLRRRPDDAPTLTDRAAPLIEEAAERSRVSWRTRVERLRLAWRSIFQASVSAALAWLIATKLLGHPTPFFAPVSAIITLGITVGQRGQRAAEVALGVALGIAIADLLVIQIGTGTAQLALVVALATSAAIFLGSGQMLATQAAVSAALVATLQPPTDGVSFARFLDALVGGGVALTDQRPGAARPAAGPDAARRRRRCWRSSRPCSTTSPSPSSGATRSSPSGRSSARGRSTSCPPASARPSTSSRETTRYAPPRRRSRGAVESYADAAGRIDLAVRNVRVLARGTIRALSLDENVPPEIAGALRDLAVAVRALPQALDDHSRGRGGARARCSGRRRGDAGARAHRQPLRERDRRPDPLDRRRPAVGHRDDPRAGDRARCATRCARRRRRSDGARLGAGARLAGRAARARRSARRPPSCSP